MIWGGQNSIAYLSLLVIFVCIKRGKNLTLKTSAPDFSARSVTKLYAKIKGAQSHSLTFLKLGRYGLVPNFLHFCVYMLLKSSNKWIKLCDGMLTRCKSQSQILLRETYSLL